MSQNINAQSGPVTIHGAIDKPETKIALYELFYNNIDKDDINLNEAEIDDQFLIVKNHNAKRSQGKLIIDGDKVFTTDLDELPFLSTVNLLDNGQLWPTEVGYYYDNYENITTEEESSGRINNPNNITVEESCIQFVIDDSFGSEYTPVFEEIVSDMSALFCCPGSSPVTFVIVPGAVALGAASPQYFGVQQDPQGICNAIPENSFMTGLLGQHQNEIAVIELNTNIDWYFREGAIGNRFDLYTVLLHDFLHGMGLASRINPDGTPLGGGYSPWDQHLEINGVPLLDRVVAPEGANCCFTFEINEDINLPNDIITASQNGQITVAGIPVCTQNNLTPNLAMNEPSLFYDMLSHLDEDCDSATDTEYVLNFGLTNGEIRDEISEDELFLLQTLGYCTNSDDDIASSCYVSLVDDSAIIIEGDDVFLNLSGNDILPTGFMPSDIFLDLTCGDASGLDVSLLNNGVQIQGLNAGEYCFCYTVDSCDEFCDKAEVCVIVRSLILSSECEPDGCLLNCFGDFEDFIPDFNIPFFGNNDYLTQLGLSSFIFEGSSGNSADIFSTNGNNFLNLFAANNQFSNIEGIVISLNEPVEDGCTILVDFDAECFGDAELVFLGSEFPICDSPLLPSSPVDQIVDICGSDNPFYNLGFDNTLIQCEELSFGDDLNSNAVIGENFDIETLNQSGGPINFITVFVNRPDEGPSVFQIDNISIFSSCSEPQIEILDFTAPEDLSVCSGNNVTIRYSICLIGGEDDQTNFTLTPNFDDLPLGSVSVSPLSPFVNDPVTIEGLTTEFCENIQLEINLSPDLFVGQQIEIVMELDNHDACNQQGGQIITTITIDDVPPSADFSALVECVNEPSVVSFTAFEPNSDQTTYAWDFGDGNSSAAPNPSHTFAQDGTYTVTLTVMNECGISTTSEIINFDCDDNPAATCPCSTEGNGIVLNDSNIDTYSLDQLIIEGILPENDFSGCLNLNGTLIIDVDYVFAGAQLIMESEAAIEIQSGISLEIGGMSALMGCDAMWDGILVNNNAALQFSDSYISDAFRAVHLMDGSKLTCQDASFKRNYIGIFVPPNANGALNSISFPMPIVRNTFEGDGNLLTDLNGSYNLLFDDNSYAGILAHDIFMSIGVSGLELSNIFKEMYNGIRAFNSTIITSRSEFRNIISNDNDIETGHGVFNESSDIFSFLNSYKNTEYGIRGNKSTLKSFQDIFDNFKVGIEMVAAPPAGTISVLDDEFSIYSERAIVVFNSPQANIECISNIITNNIIFDFTMQEAISIFDNGSKGESLLRLEDNIMLLGENQAGITLSNVLGGNVISNSVSYTDNMGFDSNWSRGFKMSNCVFTELEGNTVFGASLPSSGFETEDSPNQIFCCNSTSDNQVGIKFTGINCSNTDLKTNNMERSTDAGLSLSNTIIGGQDHKGNIWCEGSIASYEGDFNLISASRFDVDESDGGIVCQILPPTNIDGWFFDFFAETPVCGEDCISFSGERSPLEFADALAANQSFSGDFSETSNWNAGRYLLDKLELNQEGLGENSEVDLFYNENIDSQMSRYNDIKSQIEGIYKSEENQLEELQQLYLEIDVLKNLIIDSDLEIIQSHSDSERQTIIEAKVQFSIQLSEKLNFIGILKEQIILNTVQRAQDLKILNNNLLIPNLAAKNEKQINNVVLNMIIDPTILNKAKVQNTIENIANQCPAFGGLSVYRARSLNDYIHSGIQNDYSDVDNCYGTAAKSSSLSDSPYTLDGLTGIQVFPNPTTGFISISVEDHLIDGQISVIDLLGNEVLRYDMSQNETIVRLNLNIESGIYFISVNDEGQNLKYVKVIVQ